MFLNISCLTGILFHLFCSSFRFICLLMSTRMLLYVHEILWFLFKMTFQFFYLLDVHFMPIYVQDKSNLL